ncbi:uncharacterized protein UV8b_02351 [Ustilaginoidea virens]|uniref:Uncharacterized protein n=1 Tax=Ustilaginoidea virens TaxID=1159556 RepID=A0A8E5HMB8_USTVR|nr:uncharacterized protein UV8b_02351 [Ustilaginoidea virens]QUC18110.1 hypothetical protein UV8b_02351 [Ustilaginoidea virens]
MSALKDFGTNAKKGSIRAEAAWQLATLTEALFRFLGLVLSQSGVVRAMSVLGETRATSHHHHTTSLPVFMHHFGCATPSHEALEILRILSKGRAVADVGSGSGYWTFMLRGYGLT